MTNRGCVPSLERICWVFTLLAIPSGSPAATLTVDPAGGGDYAEIQSAVDAAADGDTVLVVAGVYTFAQPIDFNRLHDPASPQDHPVKDIGLIGVDGPGSTVLTPGPSSWMRHLMVFKNAETGSSLVEGFTLRGSGIACTKASSPVFRNCVTEDCWRGALDVSERATPHFENCRLIRSGLITMLDSWTGLNCWGASPRFTDCEILDAVWPEFSGGSTVTFTRCRIVNASIWAGSGSDLRMTACKFISAGVTCKDAAAALTDCAFVGQGAWWWSPMDGVVCDRGAVDLRNCTIVDFAGSGVSVLGEGGVARLVNCIVWGNERRAVEIGDGGVMDVSYSCVDQDISAGTGNLREDPRFCRGETIFVESQEDLEIALRRGYELSSSSPCIGSGEGGATMGADLGVCDAVGEGSTQIRLAAGHYTIRSTESIPSGTTVIGAGEDLTVIEGDAISLRASSKLSHLTLATELQLTTRAPVEISDCTVRGLIQCVGSSPLLDRCTISTYGVACELGAAPLLRDCLLRWNTGTALYSRDSNPHLIRCVITGNAGGGVVLIDGGVLDSCTLSGNRFFGLYCDGDSVVKNCLFTGNGGSGLTYVGAAVDCSGSSVFMNCTLSGNAVGFNVRDGEGSPRVINSISWDNVGESVRLVGSDPVITYSCVKGPEIWPGEENRNEDPLFRRHGQFDFTREAQPDMTEYTYPDFIVDAGDYHLQPASPYLDAGTFESAPTLDIEGNGRPCGSGIDTGAYEMGGCAPMGSPFRRADANTDSQVDIADAIFTLSYLFVRGQLPSCVDAADANDDGAVDVADAVYVLQHLFVDGPAIPRPYPGCGIDSTMDELGCAEYAHCE